MTSRPALLAALLLAFIIVPIALADEPPSDAAAATGTDSADDPLAGHSSHGEVFNEGPRQKAVLMGGTGDVVFPVVTENETARQFVLQGIGQLHGFWYLEAERSFRQAAALDPECAVAYWGMAMANGGNEKRAKDFIAQAVQRKAQAGPHATLYIDALDAYYKADSNKDKERRQDYVKALEAIVYAYPDDLEAKAFLGLQLWSNKGKGLPLGSPLAVDALLQDVLAKNPRHPCHHYLIHLWDYEKAERALPSAAMCGPSAPAIAHMWHMPGHIYSRLKRYRDAAWQQEASARVDHAQMIRDRLLPDQIHNFAHNNEWLIRNLIHVGRMRDAIDLAQNMISLPRHPKYNRLSKSGTSSAYGRLRLFETLAQFEQWDELIALSDTMYLEPTDEEDEQVKRLRYLGRAFFQRGNVSQGQTQRVLLEQRQTQLTAEEAASVTVAEQKVRDEARQKIASESKAASDEEPVEAPNEQQLAARIDKDSAQELEKARKAARQSFSSRKSALEAAIHELSGWDTVAAGDAKAGLESLKKAGGVSAVLLARVEQQAGQAEQAEKRLTEAVDRNKQEVLPLAHRVALRWELGKKTEAQADFEQLRRISADIDLHAPAMVRLSPIARELGYGDDWRVAATPADDLGERPALETLGPFRWYPSPAPGWTLRDAEGKEHSLADYRGRPVLVIFSLGHGCLHCAEQLQAFAPKAGAFAESGIAVIAVSTDDEDALERSLDNYQAGRFPFPLVSDVGLETFKSYRAFDDFEGTPLHGTFLIDAHGLVRWQDISYEPFMDPDFVLKEAQRLLTLSAVTTVQVAKPVSE